MRTLLLVAPVLGMIACGPAEGYIINPNSGEYIDGAADDDGDGLSNADEIDNETDPNASDSDGDGMLDGDEVKFGRDPLDPDIGLYKGDWPFQDVAVKEAIEANKKTGKKIAKGKRFPRLTMVDQYGDEVDLYDFAGHGKKIIVDISAEWCPPCQELSRLLEVGNTGDARFDQVIQAIEDEDIYWLTVLAEDNSNSAPNKKVAKNWFKAYPNKHVPVFADQDQDLVEYVILTTNGWPTVVVLNENMTIVDFNGGIDVDVMAQAL